MEPVKDGASLAIAHARAPRSCVRCGLPLDDGYWITAYPQGEHERCRDWSAQPFPFARHVVVLRSMARRTSSREVARVIDVLAGLERDWPQDPLTLLAEGRRLVRAARALIVDLDHRDRQKL